MSFTPPTRTWGDVAQNVRRSFGDESGVQLEDGDLARWIDQGQYEIARNNKVLKASGVTSTMPGQDTYQLDLGKPILQIESVRYGSTRLVPTEFTTVEANSDAYPKTASGDPSLWYVWGADIILWPVPKKAEQLKVLFTTAPERHVILDTNRVLEIPDEYFLPLVDFCMAKAHEMDDNGQSQEMSLRLYNERVSAMNNEARGGQTATFQTITMVD